MLKTPLIFIASILSAASMLGGAASPALAAPPEARTRIVSYADLNLASAAGRARLESRIERAVRAVCGSPIVWELRSFDRVQECRAEARADAAAQLRRGEVFIASAQPGQIVFSGR